MARRTRRYLATGLETFFTIANVIADLSAQPWYFAPNKTLAAQLYGEMRILPENAVNISFPTTTTISRRPMYRVPTPLLEKDASVNEHIEQIAVLATKAGCWSDVMWLWWRLFPGFMWSGRILIYISR